MKLTTKKIILLLSTIIWLFISSCAGIVRSTIKEDDKQIPIGFGKEDVTIIAVRKNNRYNKWLEQRFSENYFGKYLIINESELSSPKYNDLKIYKYFFDGAEVNRQRYTSANSNRNTSDTYISFSLTDRSTQQVYKTRNIYAAPTALMRDYLIVLEKVRQKNMGKRK